MTPWTAASQAPQSMGFSKQEYWSGLPFPSPQSFLLERKCYCFRYLTETQTKCLSPTHSSKPGLNTISSAGTLGVPPIRISPPKGDLSWVFTGRTDVEAETPYFGHLMRRADSLEKTLMLGKIEGRRRRE